MTHEIQVWKSEVLLETKRLGMSSYLSIGRTETDLVISNPKISRKHLELYFENGEVYIKDTSSNGTYINGTKLSKNNRTKLIIGKKYSLADTEISILVKKVTLESSNVSQKSKININVNSVSNSTNSSSTKKTISNTKPNRKKLTLNKKVNIDKLLESLSSKGSATIGRSPNSDFILPSLQVSNEHAKIVKSNNGYQIIDYSTNGVFVNNQRVRKQKLIDETDQIRIGPYQFYLKGIVEDKRISGETAILAQNVKKVYSNGYVGLQSLSIKISGNEFVALMGPSGCGKSTLLKALNGDNPASEGRVVIHGLELNSENYDLLKKDIGYVPQDDIVHRGLSVNDTLYFAAKLRLADDVTDEEINNQIQKVLSDLNINNPKLRENKVGELSGGQRKRVSIAVELLTEPSILFLDEPTSPLDPETIEDFLNCIKKLAEEGTTIIMVTHKPSDLKYVDSAIFLSKGGYMTYYGRPSEINEYFDQRDIIGVYSLMSKLEADNKTPLGKSWNNKWKSRNPDTAVGGSVKGTRIEKKQKSSLIRQYYWLSRRYFSLKWNDKGNMLLLLSQPFIIAFLITFIFESLQTGVLFLMAISAVWFGVSNAAKEIVGELPIYRRERMFNMSIWTYLFSKVTILSLIAFIQVVVYVAILYFNYSNSDSPVELRSYWLNVGYMFYLSVSATIMGLFLSAVFPNTEKVMTFVPIALIPQIMLAGVVAKLDNTTKEIISYLTLGRWGTEGFANIQDNQTRDKTGALWELTNSGEFVKVDLSSNDNSVEGIKFITADDDTIISSVMSPVPEIEDSIISNKIELGIPGKADTMITDTIGLPTGEMTEEPRSALDYLDFYGHEGALGVFEGFSNNMLVVTILNIVIFISLFISLKRKDSI